MLPVLSLALFMHGVHMSTATVDYQSGFKRLEIVITLSAEHMVEILKRKTGREIELDRSPDSEKLARDYVLGRFEVKDGAGKALPIQWVGWEIKGGNLNCYIESPLGSIEGLRLRNDLLMDWQRDQVNRVLPKRDGKGKPPQLMFWVGTLGQYQPILF